MLTSFLSALLLTTVIEGLVAYLMGFRDRKLYLMILLVNAMTNPILNYILMFIRYFRFYRFYLFAEVSLELAVVIVEWRLLVYALEKKPKRLFLLSLLMNLASYLFGTIFL